MYPLAICGRSRIGKSTFIRHLCGLLKNEIKTASGDKVVTQGIDLILRKFQLIGNLDQSVNEHKIKKMMASVLDIQGLNNQQDMEIQ